MTGFRNGLGFRIGTSGPGAIANLLAVLRTGGGCGGPAAHGMAELGNGLGFTHKAAVLAGIFFGS